MRRFRMVVVAAVVLAGLAVSLPSILEAASCTADNGATCTCSGRCWADANGCGCSPPPV